MYVTCILWCVHTCRTVFLIPRLQVLLQGCVVTVDNVDAVLDLVQRGLDVLECRLAESFQQVLVNTMQHNDCNVRSVLCMEKNISLSWVEWVATVRC